MPEADDQDFELSSNYFLSGVAVHMPSRDDRCPKFIPQRHGAAREVHADIIMWPYVSSNSQCRHRCSIDLLISR